MFIHKEVAVATMKIIITGTVTSEKGPLEGEQELPKADAERLIELGVARKLADVDIVSPAETPKKKR